MNPVLTSKEFSLLKKYIEEQCGISIGEEKAYLVENRLSRLLIDLRMSTFEDLYKKICCGRDEKISEKVIDAITTNETLWFRDKMPWVILEELLIPKYIKELKEKKKSRIRIWSAACSTGQEPYSIAMCIDNYLNKNGIKDVKLWDFEILATDISTTVLQKAKSGKYDSVTITRGLDDSYKEKYFEKEGSVWSVKPQIANSVRFEQFNLQNSFHRFDKFDVVFCRYVIIYFSDKLKAEVINKLTSALKPEGVLFIGSSELLNTKRDKLELKQYQNGVYYELMEQEN